MKTVTSDPLLTETSLFRVSLAQSPDHLKACQRLRYSVFNEELGEGLSTSDRERLDIDLDVDFLIDTAGHVLAERDRLESEGRWQTLRDDLEALVEHGPPLEYLLALAHK